MKKGAAKKSDRNVWYWIIGLFVLAVLLYVVYAYMNNGSPQFSPSATYRCSETDVDSRGSGNNPYAKGTTSKYKISTGALVTDSTDSCETAAGYLAASGPRLREYFCALDGSATIQTWRGSCPKGCSNGACIA